MLCAPSRSQSTECSTLKGSGISDSDNEHRPVRLLSLDGGGIRGISSIVVLREVMKHVNAGRGPKDELQPWQVFDLIGGTSTGGIIAIMLGCLQMTLDECHDAYIKLAESIFKPKRHKYNVIGRTRDFVSANERYDSSKFEQIVKKIIEKRKGSGNAPLRDPHQTSPCKVFVTTVNADKSKLVLLRSYDNREANIREAEDQKPGRFELWEALRATSAASTYFKEYRHHDNAGYLDGAFKCNNPIFEVYHEAKDLWPKRDVFLISIGTGTKPSEPLGGHVVKLARSLTKLVTETEDTWSDFHRTYNNLVSSEMLYRFNVPGIGAVNMGDYKQIKYVGTSTVSFLQGEAQEAVKKCAEKVVKIETTDYAALRKADPLVLSDEEKACFRALYCAAVDNESQRLEVEKAVPGTCEWFIEHPKFAAWLAETSASMLWVTANPGCGKSVLARFLIDTLSGEYGENGLVCSFFFKAGEDRRHQADQALCAILHQVLTSHPELVKLAMEDFSRKDSLSFTSSIKGIWKLLCAVSKRLGHLQIICIIDALDECSESTRDKFCDVLSSNFRTENGEGEEAPSNLKFLVTSRPWPSLEARLRPLRSIRLRGEDESDALARDIDKMIECKVRELEDASELSAKAARTLRRELSKGADQTFLWAALVLDTIARMPSRKLSSINETLNGIPLSLDQLYESELAGFKNQPESIKLLETLLVARRALTLEELNIALNITGSTRSVRDLQQDMEPNIEWTVKRLGGFFVRISNATVSLVHKTARDFLLKISRMNGSPTPSLVSETRAELQLATSCIRFLLLGGIHLREGGVPPVVGQWAKSNEDYLGAAPQWLRGYLEYALTNWFLHCEECTFSDMSSELAGLVNILCDPKREHFAKWWPFQDRRIFSCRVPPHTESLLLHPDRHYAHHAAIRGRYAIVYGLVESGYSDVADENDDELPLFALAAINGTSTLLRWMLGRPCCETELIGSALVTSLGARNWAAIQLLLSTRIDVNRRYRVGKKNLPTSEAAPAEMVIHSYFEFWEHDPEWVIRPEEDEGSSTDLRLLHMLIDKGLAIREEHIVRATSRGLKGCLKVLLDRDTRPLETRLPSLKAAYTEATLKGWPTCRRLVLESSEGKLADDIDASSGLNAAAVRYDVTAVEEILRLGARDDGEALFAASKWGDDILTEMLLKSQNYNQSQLNHALSVFFDMANDSHIRKHVEKGGMKALDGQGCRLFKAFPIIPTFGESEFSKYKVVEMLTERGARSAGTGLIRALVTVTPMDEEYGLYLLENMHRLQEEPAPFRRADVLLLASHLSLRRRRPVIREWSRCC
ncbi:hypothetical protein SODALDRAFT_26809 [Sodiomyces alkalinus F11]|uniref:PNPLA domain-containing protein n=1 Tax=Sodiomyces alkalinus (strain CBS 110278 / VKM F-3762 / F11) TaxID=1314773 RepID=A0A3N2Q8B5_SODAK|nr:hypothetical protein SODALDRAFT_26809 [Sodiomyces alkalinus F11]ROT42927.1 hypothetical protein SODALDRAFT_26809 [Sodiomyces alkalinus F11]